MKFEQGKTNYEEWRDHSRDNALYKARMAVIERMRDKESLTFDDELELMSCVNVSTMSGKLEGYYALSTSVLMNPICQKRAGIPGSICRECYAASTAARYTGLTQALETNHIILNTFLISENAWTGLCWPSTNGDARIEAFGDVASLTCARNYLRIIRSHPWLNFGVWTKNPTFWKWAFEMEGGKPGNMQFIISSTHVNRKQEIAEDILPYVDHRFTVYTPEFAAENGIVINCGGRKCATCRNCYRCDTAFDIAELLK